MSVINYIKLDKIAKTLNYEYYDIAEQVYSNRAETVLISYADPDHTIELEKHIMYDIEE